MNAIFALSPASLQLASVCQKAAYTLHWHPEFCSCCQRTPLQHLALKASGAHARGSHKTTANEENVLK